MKKIFAGVAIAVAAVVMTGCSTVDTNADQAALNYDHGWFSARSFSECIKPGDYKMNAPTDEFVTYPAGQRTYTFQKADQGRDGEGFTVSTQDNVTLGVEGVVRFQLNTEDCDKFREFHERVGNKFNASTDEGWKNLLATYLRQPLNRAITEATQGLTWRNVYSDADAKRNWEKTVNDILPKAVNQAMGGDYFTNFAITLQKPVLPEELLKALQDTQTAIQQNAAQSERNKQVNTELESVKALVAVLGPDGYNVYQAIKDGRIQVMPIPQGSGIALPPGK